MPKRFALFIIGFVLAIGAFLLYQYYSGAAFVGTPRQRTFTTGPATTQPMALEQRNEKGELEYLITAESVTPLRDEKQNALPNQLLLKKPVATSYDKSGRTIQISADECRVIIDQGVRTNTRGTGNLLTGAGSGLGPGGPGGAGDRATGRLLSTVRLGRLSGHVKLSIGKRPAVEGDAEIAASTRIPLRSELNIFFDKDLEFDGNEKILSSAGKVYVRSDTAAFDGEGMQLKFNLDAKRVEYFRMDKGNRAVIRGVGGKALELAGGAETKPAAKAPEKAVAAAKPKEPPVAYKVSFGQDVRVAVLKKEKAEGESVMTSEQLFLYFIAGGDLMGDGSTDLDDKISGAPEKKPAEAATRAVARGDSDRPGPMPEPQPNDLVITWQGSVEMRPAGAQDPQLADGKDVAMEAIGTLEKPVRVTDSRFAAVVGRLLFRRSEERIALLPGAYQKVELIDPNKGRVVCQDVVYSQKDNIAKLTGPGMLEARSAAKAGAPAETTRVSWAEWMTLEMAKVPDPKDAAKTTMAVRRAVINGVGIHSDAIDMSTDLMDVLIANVPDGKGGSTPAMERLVATGNVMVDSLKRAGVASVPDKKDGLRAKRMEILTTKDASGVPVASQMIADGEAGGVSAWQYQSTDKKLPNESSLLERRMVTTTRLVADLRAKPKVAGGTAAVAANQETEIAGMGQGFDVTHMVSSAGARVEITPSEASAAGSKKPTIVATADVLEADPVGETAELKGAEGVASSLVRIVLGENSMQGKRVVLDQRKQVITVPGAGQFLFTLPADKTRSQPTPMEVTWGLEMQYDNKAKVAVFKGNPVAQIVGDNADLGRIASRDLLTVKMKEKAGTTKPANGGADLLASTSLELDYIQAEGMVDARGAQLGADNKVLTQLRINTDKVLTYRDAEQVFDVPSGGSMVIDNHKPDKAGSKMKGEGTSGFKWEGSLRYDGKANTITFLKNVDFFFKPREPWVMAAASGGGSGLLGGVGETAATKPAEAKKIELVHVRTNRIVATLMKAKEGEAGKTPASPIGLGAGGNQELKNVVADGGAELTAGAFGLEGSMLEFDVPTNMAVAAGTADQPAMATRAEEPPIMADRITWNSGTNTLTSSGVRGRVRGN